MSTTRYRHMVAWGRLTEIDPYSVEREAALAAEDDAPDDVIYRISRVNFINARLGALARSEDPLPPEHYFRAPSGRVWWRYASVTNQDSRARIDTYLAEETP